MIDVEQIRREIGDSAARLAMKRVTYVYRRPGQWFTEREVEVLDRNLRGLWEPRIAKRV